MKALKTATVFCLAALLLCACTVRTENLPGTETDARTLASPETAEDPRLETAPGTDAAETAAAAPAVTEAVPQTESIPQTETLPPFTDRSATAELPQVFSTQEYADYQNYFYNREADSFTGLQMTKTGVFTKIHDSWNNCDRFYVWGYFDRTKCCDWQWEFVPSDVSALPPQGSLVEMTGTFEKSDGALDQYWFTSCTLETLQTYTGALSDVPMDTMNATLERVQILNMIYYASEYDGMTVTAYGRVLDGASFQHPYYDGVWTLDFVTEDTVPAPGTEVLVSGVLAAGADTETGIRFAEASVRETTDY